LSDSSQSKGPPALLFGRLRRAAAAAPPAGPDDPDDGAAAADVADVTADHTHTQQWRLRLGLPHRAMREGGVGDGGGGVKG